MLIVDVLRFFNAFILLLMLPSANPTRKAIVES